MHCMYSRPAAICLYLIIALVLLSSLVALVVIGVLIIAPYRRVAQFEETIPDDHLYLLELRFWRNYF